MYILNSSKQTIDKLRMSCRFSKKSSTKFLEKLYELEVRFKENFHLRILVEKSLSKI